jgi:hypothetical protein
MVGQAEVKATLQIIWMNRFSRRGRCSRWRRTLRAASDEDRRFLHRLCRRFNEDKLLRWTTGHSYAIMLGIRASLRTDMAIDVATGCEELGITADSFPITWRHPVSVTDSVDWFYRCSITHTWGRQASNSDGGDSGATTRPTRLHHWIGRVLVPRWEKTPTEIKSSGSIWDATCRENWHPWSKQILAFERKSSSWWIFNKNTHMNMDVTCKDSVLNSVCIVCGLYASLLCRGRM